MNWRIILPVIGASCLGCSVASPAWFFSLIGFIPIVYVCTGPRHSQSRVLFVATLYGLVLYGTVFLTLFQVVPLDWLGVPLSHFFQYIIIACVWALCTVALSSTLVIWAVWARFVSRGDWTDTLLLPAGFVVAEYIGAFIFSLITFGGEGALGDHFSAAFIGYTLADDGVLRQLASVGGIYILSAVVMGVNVLLARCFFISPPRISPSAVVLAILFTIWSTLTLSGYPNIKNTEGEQIAIAALSSQIIAYPNISQETISAYHASVQQMVASHASSQLIVLPENIAFFNNLTVDNRHQIASLFRKHKPIIIDSGKVPSEDGYTARAEYIDTHSGVRSYSYKHVLAPFGEHASYLQQALVALSRPGSFLRRVQEEHAYRAGPRAHPVSINGVSFVALFCNEVLSPALYRDATRDGAEILVALAAHDWFHGSRLVYLQAFRAAQIRAVENGRYFVQASNVSPAFILDEAGSLRAETAWREWGVAEDVGTLQNSKTFYVQYGGFIVPLCTLLALISSLCALLNARDVSQKVPR